MNKHTPGPWLRDGRTVYALNAKNLNRFYFSVMDAHTPESELLAVATLAQAAPDLLESLEQAVTSMQDSGYPNSHVAVRAARQAIARARGKA